jgi:hypothetical protein
MKKYIESIMMLFIGMVVVTACSNKDDDNYSWATVSGEQVFFSTDLKSSVETPTDVNSFTVTLNRIKTDGELTVPLKITSSDGCIYTPAANQVTFADGAKTADLTFNYDPTAVVFGTYYDITISIDNPELTTPYGSSQYTFKAGMSEWEKMTGKAVYQEDFICSLYDAPQQWTVEIEKSVVTPGRYKLIAPYGPNTDFPKYAVKLGFYGDVSEAKGAYKDGGNTSMIINAQDPDYVYFEAFETGYTDLNGDLEGAVGLISYVWYWLNGGTPMETIKSARPTYFGKLKDGVITFTEPKTCITTLDGELAYYGNLNGKLAIALPGYALKDYDAEITFKGVFTDPSQAVTAMCDLQLGADVTTVKAIVVEDAADDGAVADAILAGDIEGTDVEAGTIYVPIAEDLSGKLKVVAVVIAENEVKTVVSAGFEYYGGGASPWKSLGKGYFVDDMICPLFGYSVADYGNEYPVEIDESTSTPGLYRLKAMFSAVAADFGATSGSGDVLVHAENPNAVYIPLQPLELTIGSNGPFSMSTDAGELVEKYGFDAVYAQLPNIFGKLENGVITFPLLQETGSDESTVDYQCWVILNDKYYFGGMSGSFKIVLPSASAEVKAKAKRAAKARKFANSLKGTFGKPSPKKQFALRVNKYRVKKVNR